jgi:hypothetical protein
MKLWRDTIRKVFLGIQGIYPHGLGDEIVAPLPRPMLRNMPSFLAILSQYDTEYGSILGQVNFGEDQVRQIITLLQNGELYAGSDGSVKNGRGSHAYGFTSGVKRGDIWGGCAITPGTQQEMSSLRAEHGGAVGILLILYAIQIYMGPKMNGSKYTVKLWIDNAETLDRGGGKPFGKSLKDNLVLDFDLWKVMRMLQQRITFNLTWNKVDSHIESRKYAYGATPKGDECSIRLNQKVDKWAEEARVLGERLLGNEASPQYFYKPSTIMAKLGQSQLLYGDITKYIREDISKRNLRQHLMQKNPAWTDTIFNSINWNAIKAHLQKQSATRTTNIIKLVHGWQNDGYQKGLFYGITEESMCPTGCGLVETRQHYMRCTAPTLGASYSQLHMAFKRKHAGIHTAKPIYDIMLKILKFIRTDEAPVLVTHFESDMDRTIKEAWEEQKEIGWDQVLKGRLSSKWGVAQAMYYSSNVLLNASFQYTGETWMEKTVGSFIDMTLGMWNARCDVLHGADEVATKIKKKNRILQQVQLHYDQAHLTPSNYQYLFIESFEEMCSKSLQYLGKWVETIESIRKTRDEREHYNIGTNVSETQ